MRYVSFFHAGVARAGVVSGDGDSVRPFPARIATLLDYLAYDGAERASLATEAPIPLAEVTLDAPIRPRKNVMCIGRNYLAHAEEGARAAGRDLKLPSVPTFFTKAPTAIAAPGATLRLDASVSPEYDWEGELAVVIGRRCKDLDEATALDAVFGYTCLNDVTARDLQTSHLQWFKGKSLDDTCPLGPWIVGADEIDDPQDLAIEVRVDGEIKQSSNTSKMIFGIARALASLSRGMTLEPGDVLSTGTPDGVGFARTPPEFLRDGQHVDVTIEKIGTLRNAFAIR